MDREKERSAVESGLVKKKRKSMRKLKLEGTFRDAAGKTAGNK